MTSSRGKNSRLRGSATFSKTTHVFSSKTETEHCRGCSFMAVSARSGRLGGVRPHNIPCKKNPRSGMERPDLPPLMTGEAGVGAFLLTARSGRGGRNQVMIQTCNARRTISSPHRGCRPRLRVVGGSPLCGQAWQPVSRSQVKVLVTQSPYTVVWCGQDKIAWHRPVFGKHPPKWRI